MASCMAIALTMTGMTAQDDNKLTLEDLIPGGERYVAHIPENIYGYFSFEGDRRLKGSLVTIAFGDGYLFSGTADASGYILAAPDTVVNGRLVVSSMRNFYGATVRIAVPLLPLYSDVALIAGVTVACSAALIVATHFIARRAADATDERLNALLAKMTASTQRFS